MSYSITKNDYSYTIIKVFIKHNYNFLIVTMIIFSFIFTHLIETAFSNKDLASSNSFLSFKIFAKLFIA